MTSSLSSDNGLIRLKGGGDEIVLFFLTRDQREIIVDSKQTKVNAIRTMDDDLYAIHWNHLHIRT